jgi:hypothetical protein
MAISRFDLDSGVDRLIYYPGQGHALGLPTRPGTSSAATTGVPTNGIQGFMPGAIFINFKGVTGTAFYINVGTFASAQWVASDLGLNGLVTLITTTTLTALLNGGRNNLLSLAGGFTSTLPAATGTGMLYTFTVGIVSTTGYVVKTAPSTDIFAGSLLLGIDASNTSSPTLFKTASNSNTITLNGTTTGGVTIGDSFTLQDIAAGVWSVSGTLVGSSALATPFSHV